jgi:nicotinate-nucleotide adenylyltransferase
LSGSGHTARTGIFGGTFDPVHNAHLALAKAALRQYALARVLFIPAGRPPFKGTAGASWRDRVAMLRLALTTEAGEGLDVSEIEDPSLSTAPSYSIVTVERLLAEGTGPLSFIVGADAFADLTKWHRWQDLATHVEFLVAPRPGAGFAVPPGVIVRELTLPPHAVSSSAVRLEIEEAFTGGQPPADLAPPVWDYIRAHGLYRSRVK